MFSKQQKSMLVCVVNEFQVNDLKFIVKSIDENAFMYSCKVSEVINENFIRVDENPEVFSQKPQLVDINNQEIKSKSKTDAKKNVNSTKATVNAQSKKGKVRAKGKTIKNKEK